MRMPSPAEVLRQARALQKRALAAGLSLRSPEASLRFARLPAQRQSALLLLVEATSVLEETGWFESVASQSAVDARGEPLPWFAYAAIDFLAPRVTPSMRVLEFGSGNSTLWWARRVAQVTSFESDPAWHRKTSARVPANVSLQLEDIHSEQVLEERVFPALGSYEVIVVDGGARGPLLSKACEHCSPDGVIILDNSDRPQYAPAMAELGRAGYRELTFRGHGPINPYAWATTVFYRSDNCLGI